MEDTLYKLCRSLRLGTNMVDNAKAIRKDNIIEFLLELFTLEIENRELKRKNAYIKQAKFDLIKAFEDYSFEDIKIPKSITPNEIMDSVFINKKENLIFTAMWVPGKHIWPLPSESPLATMVKRLSFTARFLSLTSWSK
ncbi:MAG: hypothetical protein AB9835_02025 [Eubacteriales bacterium]